MPFRNAHELNNDFFFFEAGLRLTCVDSYGCENLRGLKMRVKSIRRESPLPPPLSLSRFSEATPSASQVNSSCTTESLETWILLTELTGIQAFEANHSLHLLLGAQNQRLGGEQDLFSSF